MPGPPVTLQKSAKNQQIAFVLARLPVVASL
jgi:hypothetical protein